MTGRIILFGLALLIFLFLRTRLGVRVKISPDYYEVRIYFGVFSFQIAPPKRVEKPKRVKPKKPKPPEAVEKKPALTATSVMDMIPALRRAVARLLKGIVIDILYLHFVAAGGDAAQAALLFGAAHAGLGLVAPLTRKAKQCDISVGLDYSLPKPLVYLSTALSIRVYTVLSVGINLLVMFWRRSRRVSYGNTSNNNKKDEV